jgi:hypothetical protein
MKKGALQQSGASAGLLCVCGRVQMCDDTVDVSGKTVQWAAMQVERAVEMIRECAGTQAELQGRWERQQHDGDLPDVDETSMPGELKADGMMENQRAHRDTEDAQTTKKERAPCGQQGMIERSTASVRVGEQLTCSPSTMK